MGQEGVLDRLLKRLDLAASRGISSAAISASSASSALARAAFSSKSRRALANVSQFSSSPFVRLYSRVISPARFASEKNPSVAIADSSSGMRLRFFSMSGP